jgi:hypothetical protein
MPAVEDHAHRQRGRAAQGGDHDVLVSPVRTPIASRRATLLPDGCVDLLFRFISSRSDGLLVGVATAPRLPDSTSALFSWTSASPRARPARCWASRPAN